MEQREKDALDAHITGNYGEDSVGDDGVERQVHHYHHYTIAPPSLSLRGERNTKGWNIEVGVSGARSVEEAGKLIAELKREAERQFGSITEVR